MIRRTINRWCARRLAKQGENMRRDSVKAKARALRAELHLPALDALK